MRSNRLTDRLSLNKVVLCAIVMNTLQIIAVILFVIILMVDMQFTRFNGVLIGSMIAALLVVVWGAIMDIGEAFSAKRLSEQSEMLEEAYRSMEELNATLRAQRHDFKNHLQVVYGLIEMDEYQSAQEYIGKVYKDISRVSKALKTSIPAVNALIAAKISDCDERSIVFETDIRSNLSELCVSSWEICRVLGNLIDNAIEALYESDRTDKQICVSFNEDIHAYLFSVSNNGPRIPDELQRSIFEMGFTTKHTGHGMGLHIVKEIIREYDGTISITSDDSSTCFTLSIPKTMLARETC